MTAFPDHFKFSPLAADRTPRPIGLDRREPSSSLPAGREARQLLLERMVAEHSRLIFRVALAVVRDPSEAEEVVQETFLQILRASPGRFQPGDLEDEPSYLARIAWRLAVRRRRRFWPAPTEPELLQQLPDPGESPEDTAIETSLQLWLHREIDHLPEKLRQPLALTALGELTSPQVAAILGIPEGTVRRRIHEARHLLRRRLEMKKGGSR